MWSHTSNTHIRLHGVDMYKLILCTPKKQQHIDFYFLLRNQYGYGTRALECICKTWGKRVCTRAVFLNLRASDLYRALASITHGRERPEETTVRYKISLVQLITNLNAILYLSTCHTVYISVLILFMITP